MSGIISHEPPPSPRESRTCYYCKRENPETRPIRSPYGPYSVTLCPLHSADTFLAEIERKRQSES